MIEAELKARVHSPEAVMRQLDERAEARVEIYQDTYYDEPGRQLEKRDQELRVRTVHGRDGLRTVLAFKDATVDEASGSKPEHETRVDDSQAAHAILQGLGYVPVIAFQKRCRNYDFTAHGRRMLATFVRVPEIDGTFLEVEAIVDEGELSAALEDIRAVLGELGIGPDSLTRELYTDAVAAQRS
ncbi:class IV adenylate cyclase [Streptomyces sp. NPDC005485]|uniref:class IV adenylate cyclase n=1 Tax=Streptomyces sp. NPDC005485 TaxID=3155591 RepID=UPI0033BD2205